MPEAPFLIGPGETDDTPWVSVSDLMSGLMIVFLCMAVLFMREREQSIDEQKAIAEEYDRVQGDLAAALERELDSEELARWGAELVGDGLVIRFKDPSTLFQGGSAQLSKRFEDVLAEFFPQLIEVVTRPAFREHVREVRIEGHTSSEWMFGGKNLPADETYLKNMDLSQRRAYAVLAFLLAEVPEAAPNRPLLHRWLRANGLSSSQLIVDAETGNEDPSRSRRVEFRVVTDAEDSMRRIVTEIRVAAP